MTRRRRGAPELVIIYWRDIPAQVIASAGGHKETLVLEDRFQHAIDRAAAVAGLTETQAYVGEWRRETRPLEDEPGVAAQATADLLQSTFDRERLEAMVQAGGLDLTNDSPTRQDLP